jgi:hypothetical protein
VPLPRTLYIEQKTDGNRTLDDRGPAWIAEVTYSGSGRTVRWAGRSFERIRGGGIDGNYRCLEDGNEYWITGVKKRGSNRRYSNLPVIDTRTPPKPGS